MKTIRSILGDIVHWWHLSGLNVMVPIASTSPTHTKEAENDLFYINSSQQKIGELYQNNKMDFKFQGLDKTKQTGPI